MYKVWVVLFVCLFRYIDGLIASWLTQNRCLCPGCVNKYKVDVILECVGPVKNKDSLAFPGSML